MEIFTFSVFGWEYTFWTNLVQKFKIVSLSWNFLPKVIQIFKIQWQRSVFLFYTGNTLFYCLCNRTGVDTLKQTAVANMAFFILLQWMRLWIAFVHCLKNF